MKKLGRSLQFFAMVLLPFGMYMELSGSLGQPYVFGVNNLLVVMCFGVAMFALGRIIEGYGG